MCSYSLYKVHIPFLPLVFVIYVEVFLKMFFLITLFFCICFNLFQGHLARYDTLKCAVYTSVGNIRILLLSDIELNKNPSGIKFSEGDK